MIKKLNEDALKNELAGSAFFVRTEHYRLPYPTGAKACKTGNGQGGEKASRSTGRSVDQSID